jgi:hypothetical protein
MRRAKWVFVCLLALLLNVEASAQVKAPQRLSDEQEAHVRDVINSLDKFNSLRLSLEAGERGDGKHREWMDEMRSLGFKQANYALKFVWNRKLTKLAIVEVSYHPKYYQYDVRVTDPAVLQRIISSGLKRKLDAETTERARNLIPALIASDKSFSRALTDRRARACGEVSINLLDDETLPAIVEMPTIDFCGRPHKNRRRRPQTGRNTQRASWF